MKIYTAVQRIITPSGVVHAHVGPDVAFTKNGKLTTHKRSLGEGLVNWSYNVEGEVAPGSKVYTVQEKACVAGDTLYIQAGPDIAYATKKEAQRALKTLRQSDSGWELCLYSFKVGEAAAPALQPFTVTIMARSQAEADALANGGGRAA